MQEARMLGSYVQYLAGQKNISVPELGKILSCSENQVLSFFRGRAFASFDRLSSLAEALGTTVDILLDGDETIYNESVVHCMNDFDNPDNREKILDLIDNYMDILDAVNC